MPLHLWTNTNIFILRIIPNSLSNQPLKFQTLDNQELSFIHLHQIPGMFIDKNIFLFCIGDMCVYFCCADRAVAKHFLNIPDIHILFQQQGGKRMSEHMWGNVLADACQGGVAVDHKTNGLGGKFVL